jgi:putative aldouronate transport system permease protein
MKFKLNFGEQIFNVFNYLFMVGIVVLMLYPLLYVLFASLSKPDALVSSRGMLWGPLGFSIDAYTRVFDNPMIAIGYRNTLFYVVAGTIINVIMTALGAYVLSRRNLMFRRPISLIIIFTLFFSGGLIPTFLLVGRTLNLIDNPLSLLLPGAISTVNLIIMRTAFEGLPYELEEAARMDGANDLHILFRIVLPLSMPVVAVMILFYAVAQWNSYFPAMIYLRTRDLYPLQIVLRDILIANSTDSMVAGVSGGDQMPIGETIKYATIIVATVPILLIYPFLQRYFVKGVLIGAVKE